MPRDELLYLREIREACELLIRFVHGRTQAEVVGDDVLSAAVLQKFMIIGEAASRLSAELREQHSNVEWSSLIGMRNFVVHGYFAINWDIVWNSATVDVPDLLTELISAFPDLLADT